MTSLLVAHADGQFVVIGHCSLNFLPEGKRDGDFAFRVARIEHLLFQMKPFKSRCDPLKISGGEWHFAQPFRVEILFAGFEISGLQVCNSDTLRAPFLLAAAAACA